MRYTTPSVALAAALLLAPAAMAQSQQGTGTATNPPSGSTATMPSGTTTPGATTGSGQAQPSATVPAAGANSFTEGQARRRIEDAGFTEVKDLRKDDQGVWRGNAMRNGTQTPVGLDFEGKVVTGTTPAR